MALRDRTRRVFYGFAVTASALAVTVYYATARGQDFNWDQRHYHIGIPFLLEHGTFWKSIAPAGVPSYLNPYLLQLQFLGIQHLSPIGFAVVLGAAQSFAFVLAGVICADIARPIGGWEATTVALLGFALCMMAPMPLSEAGTTFTDLLIAVPVLAAYALLLTRGRWLNSIVSAALAGSLLGAAAALKLTNVVFALGAVGFALAGRDQRRERMTWLLTLGLTGLVTFAAIDGPWQLALWEHFHNPFFPFYNNIFRSPDFRPIAFHDGRFLPHSILAIWRYPVFWLLGGSPNPRVVSSSSEVAFIDARWIVAVGGITLFLAALVIFRRWSRMRLADPATGLLFAFAIGYLLWLFEFGVQRYVAPLDVLCGAVLLILAMQVRLSALRLLLLAAVAILSFQTMVVPNWGHIPWQSHWQPLSQHPLNFGGPSIVFLSVSPSLFIAPSLPANSRYVGVYKAFKLAANDDTSMATHLKRELASSSNFRLKEVDRGKVPPFSARVLAGYGLQVTNRCELLHLVGQTFRICDVARHQPSFGSPHSTQ